MHTGPCFVVPSTCTTSALILLAAGYPFPLFVLAESSVCPTIGALPCSLSPVFFHFRPHFRVLYSCLSFSCFLFSFSLRGKAAQETPLPPALEGKISPRRQILSLVCWKPVGRFFHHRSGTPQAVGHTSGSAEMSVRSLLFISIQSVWNTLGASLDPLLT